MLFGKSAQANDRYHETTFSLANSRKGRADVVFRCYNDAIAVRYELPTGEPSASMTITDETTSFVSRATRRHMCNIWRISRLHTSTM